ncbi:DNA-directed RNA polymerase subunit RPC12/RpoP [Desulfitispora alkaliphila]
MIEVISLMNLYSCRQCNMEFAMGRNSNPEQCPSCGSVDWIMVDDEVFTVKIRKGGERNERGSARKNSNCLTVIK